MIRGLYTSASGMLAGVMHTDTVTNNLANVNTAGYKKDTAVTHEFREMLIYRINDGALSGGQLSFPAAATPLGFLGTGVTVDQIYTSHIQGIMRNTGNPLDMAISGQGYFVVNTDNGLCYTRNGAFTLNAEQELVTADGGKVMGTQGPIRLSGHQIRVDEAGNVYSDGALVDKLRIVSFADEGVLEKQGGSYFKPAGPVAELTAQGIIQQGFLEGANVNTVSEMVDLINVFRSYEANQKMIQTQDDTLGKAVNEVGKV